MLKKFWGRVVLFFIRPGLDALEEERRPLREQMMAAVINTDGHVVLSKSSVERAAVKNCQIADA